MGVGIGVVGFVRIPFVPVVPGRDPFYFKGDPPCIISDI